MSTQLNRRKFLSGLAAVGASLALPVPLQEATAAQVNKAWKTLVQDPWFFEVNDVGTIVEADVAEPRLRSDVFDVSSRGFRNAGELVAEVDGCSPLVSYFRRAARQELEDINSELASDEHDEDDADVEQDPEVAQAQDEAWARNRLTPERRAYLQKLATALEDEDYGWQEWVEMEGATDLSRFTDLIEEWMAGDLDGSEYEWFPPSWGNQGMAMSFFEDLDRDTRKALGVVIIDGEHPGSSYFAAELRGDLDSANATAQRLGLPFRFRKEA